MIKQEVSNRTPRVFYNDGAKAAATGKNRPAPLMAAALHESFFAAPCKRPEAFDDRLKTSDDATFPMAVSAQEFQLFADDKPENGYEEKTVQFYNPHLTLSGRLSQSKVRLHGEAYSTNKACPQLKEYSAPAAVNLSSDISPALLAAIFSSAFEMSEIAQAQGHALQDENENQLFSCQMIEYARVRLFSLAISFSSFGAKEFIEHQQSKKASVALLWFLRRHQKLAATMTSMAFSLFLGLERYGLSWKRAVEVPLIGLQLLASYAHVVSFQHAVNTFDAQRPREHLFVMAACLLASWKFAEVDASATILVNILNECFFNRHCVLNLRDVNRAEFIVLEACGLCVNVPCWWRVAIELVTELMVDEEEVQAVVVTGIKGLGLSSHTAGGKSESKHGSEAKLVQLLLASERLLLFVMDVLSVGDEAGAIDEEERCAMSGGCRLRKTLCRWMESHPLFGVALAVASGAVGLHWAASRVAPTGGGAEGRKEWRGRWCCRAPPATTGEVDEAAWQEVRMMVPAVMEALCHVSAVEARHSFFISCPK